MPEKENQENTEESMIQKSVSNAQYGEYRQQYCIKTIKLDKTRS